MDIDVEGHRIAWGRIGAGPPLVLLQGAPEAVVAAVLPRLMQPLHRPG